MLKGRVIAIIISIVLALGVALPAVAAAPPDNPGKGHKGLTKIVFVNYPKGVEAKGGIPGKPGGDKENDKKLWYSYEGVHWDNNDWPNPVEVNIVVEEYTAQDPDDTFEDAIIAAFETWEGTGATIDFIGEEVQALALGMPSSYVIDADNPYGTANGVNEVGWVSFTALGLPSNAIAQTVVWVYTGTTIIAEVDMGMNSDMKWAQDNSVSRPNKETADVSDAYDVQNIAIHEAGHFLMLEDLYMKPARNQTMYGYGALGELKKRDLESGDIAGILEIYPAP